MSVLIVGVSHKSAPVSVLERLALDEEAAEKLAHQVMTCDHVQETTVLATCNRIEVYAEVDRFHGSVEQLSRLLCERAGERPEEIVPHLYVHYDDGAVSHLFHVTAGLDSMVLGEGQVLGQVRNALRLGQEWGTIGSALNVLFQQALRVGKRVHAETDIDRTAPSLVSAAVSSAEAHVGSIAGTRVVVVGAGAMASLSVVNLARLGARDIVVANRTPERAQRLAEEYGVRTIRLDEVDRELPGADVLVSCTGATGVVLPLHRIAEARAGAGADLPMAVVDLALPHDVDPTVADLPGVKLIGLARLAEELTEADGAAGLTAVREIVSQEIAAFVAARHTASVTPTVIALRTMATGVVEGEMDRLLSRLPDLDPQIRAEVELAVRRVADKLLHQPTVRVKELANQSGAVSYATALAELFSLDPEAVDAVTRAEGVAP